MRLLRLVAPLILILMIFTLSPKVDWAQGNFLGNCTNASGSSVYRPDGVVVRYEYWGKQFELINMHTGGVAQILESSFVTSDLANLDWSPDCHYLFGTANGDAIVWDAINGGRVATFAGIKPKNPPYWNPSGSNLILEAYGGSFLWNFHTTSTPILLGYSGDICPLSYYNLYNGWEVEWDNARNQVLVVPNFVNGNVVIAYDQTSGQQVAAFDNDCLRGPLHFNITPDDRHILVFTDDGNYASYAGYDKAITVWDRDTMQHVTVDANTQSAALTGQVALSPDGHYLILARLGTMRVWDMTNLADDVGSRDPIHRYPITSTTWSVRFVSDTVVETTDLNGKTVRWDVTTGAQVN